MSDFEISKLVGMRTYCQLYKYNPELYTQRPECNDFECYNYNNDPDINYVTVLVSEGTDMCKIKEDLKIVIRTGRIPPSVTNLVHSSWSCEYPAISLSYSIIWIIFVVALVSIITYCLIINGIVHKVFQQQFTPDQFYYRYI